MADLFGYTQTDNVRVDTRPTMVNQRPDMRAADAFNSISSLLQTGVKAYGMAKESKQKDSFLEASKEANSLYDWYSGEVNKTEDAYEKANILEQYKTGLSSIKEGYQLSEENALTFDNATKRFVGSQTMAIDTIVKKQQVSDIDSGMTEIFKTMVSSPIEDVAKMMKDASSAYDVVGMDKKEVSDKLFSMYASIKINGLQTKEAWATDASTITQELKDVAKAYDPKLIGKDSYTKFIGQLDKIKTIQSQSMKDSVKIFEASDEFKNYIVPPKDYLTFLESNNVADAKAKAIIYNKDYEMLSKYDPINVHPDSTANPELAKKRANLVINQAMQGGDYVTALNVIDTTGEVGGLRAAVTTGINSNDVNTLNNTANIVRKMFNMNSVAMIDKVLTNETDRAIGMYLSHLVETSGQITETDVAFIDKAKQNKERYPLSKEFNENFKKDYGTTYDFAKNKQVASIMAKMGVPEDKIEEHFKAYYDKTIITDVIDMSGVGNLPYSNDIIEEALTPILDDFKATNFTKPSFVYNPGTQTMWLANEGIITQDTGIAIDGEGGLKDIIGGYVNHKAFYEELEKQKREESGNDDTLGFSEANKSNAYYDLFERGGGLFNRFIEAFKKPFNLEGSDLPIEEVTKYNEQSAKVYDKLKAKGFDDTFLEQARKALNIKTDENIKDNTSEIWGKFYQTTNNNIKKNKFEDNVKKYYGTNIKFKDTINEVLPAFDYEIKQLGYDNKQMSELLYKTALHESAGFKYKKQLKNGPARSYLQVEPDTAYDNIHNGTALIGKKFEKAVGVSLKDLKQMDKKKLSDLLLNNEKFAIAIATIKYIRSIK